MQLDVISENGSGRRFWRIAPQKLAGHQLLVERGFASRAEDGPAILTLIPAARIAGRVVSKLPGVSLAGLRAFVQNTFPSRRHQEKDAAIEPDGRFTIDGLDEGPVNISLWGRGSDEPWTYHPAYNVRLRAGAAAEVTIELIRGVEVEGRVFVQGTKQPVPNATVLGRDRPVVRKRGASALSEDRRPGPLSSSGFHPARPVLPCPGRRRATRLRRTMSRGQL